MSGGGILLVLTSSDPFVCWRRRRDLRDSPVYNCRKITHTETNHVSTCPKLALISLGHEMIVPHERELFFSSPLKGHSANCWEQQQYTHCHRVSCLSLSSLPHVADEWLVHFNLKVEKDPLSDVQLCGLEKKRLDLKKTVDFSPPITTITRIYTVSCCWGEHFLFYIYKHGKYSFTNWTCSQSINTHTLLLLLLLLAASCFVCLRCVCV